MKGKLTMSKDMLGVKDVKGAITDLLGKLGGDDSFAWFAEFKKFLRKEPCWVLVSEPTRSWREEAGVIYFSVTSDGTAGEDWIIRLESKGFRVGNYAKQVLCSPSFKPTSGVTTEVAVLKGILFEGNHRTTENIRAEGALRKLSNPNAEIACLIREQFADKEIKAMGLTWIVTMHEPIEDFEGDPTLLDINCADGGRWFVSHHGRPDHAWYCGHGFAFAVSQASSQS